MKKIACVALALSLAATAAFAEAGGGLYVGADVTALAPAGVAGIEGATVVIAGVGTATWTLVGGALLLLLTILAPDSSPDSP